jgi:hypothetical protein
MDPNDVSVRYELRQHVSAPRSFRSLNVGTSATPFAM